MRTQKRFGMWRDIEIQKILKQGQEYESTDDWDFLVGRGGGQKIWNVVCGGLEMLGNIGKGGLENWECSVKG